MAKKIEAYGKKFDNEYEKEFFEYLKSKCIPFQYNKKVNLIPESEYGKAIGWNIDFYIESLDIYIDIKGLNKTISFENLKKRLFQEKYGNKIYFIAEAPAWYQKEFGKKYIEYETKNKIEVLSRAFKKKNEIKRIGDKIDLSKLIEKIKEKGLFPFDKI